MVVVVEKQVRRQRKKNGFKSPDQFFDRVNPPPWLMDIGPAMRQRGKVKAGNLNNAFDELGKVLGPSEGDGVVRPFIGFEMTDPCGIGIKLGVWRQRQSFCVL